MMEFIIKDITKYDAGTSLLAAKVEFRLSDEVGSTAVAQSLSFDLRIESHDDLTIAQLEELLLNKATDQLRAVLSKCEGKTAHELRISSDDLSSILFPDE